MEIVRIWVFPKIGVFPPKSSISIGFSIINHPFWGTTIFGTTHMLGSVSMLAKGRRLLIVVKIFLLFERLEG